MSTPQSSPCFGCRWWGIDCRTAAEADAPRPECFELLDEPPLMPTDLYDTREASDE